MTSIFGLPFEKLDNLSSNEHLQFEVEGEEKSIFVGGRYNPYHDNIFLLFGLNTTTDTQHILLLSTVFRLVALLPPLTIILCQAGFALVQSGASKFDSAALPYFVNVITFALSVISYWVFGYAVSQTDGYSVLGYHYWFSSGYDSQDSPDWVLGFALALTSANIANYGGLERCPLLGYVIQAPVISGIVHGLVVHWAWHFDGWLLEFCSFAHVKYRDFSGSGIVYIVGGASALALSVVLGPRYSRICGRNSKVVYNDLEGHSVPSEMFGGYLLCVCYTCISCARVFQTCVNCDPMEAMALTLINTLLSGGASCLFTVLIVMVVRKLFGRGRIHWPTSRFVVNGLHVGMVAVAAGCNVYHHWTAFLVGMTSSVGYVLWSLFLYNANNDDPVGVAAVHLGGGLWGLLCVNLFEKEIGLVFGKDLMLSFLGMVWNLIGGLTIAAFSALLMVLAFAVPRILNLLPLPHVQEIQGLDMICLQQDAYSLGHKVTPFNTDSIEDRECFGDESPASTAVTSLMSPAARPLSKIGIEESTPYITEISKSATLDLAYIPSLYRSPSVDGERRVWFTNGCMSDQVAPDSPLIDYHKNYKEINDIEL